MAQQLYAGGATEPGRPEGRPAAVMELQTGSVNPLDLKTRGYDDDQYLWDHSTKAEQNTIKVSLLVDHYPAPADLLIKHIRPRLMFVHHLSVRYNSLDCKVRNIVFSCGSDHKKT